MDRGILKKLQLVLLMAAVALVGTAAIPSPSQAIDPCFTPQRPCDGGNHYCGWVELADGSQQQCWWSGPPGPDCF